MSTNVRKNLKTLEHVSFISRTTQYLCLLGITPRTPPLGSTTSPSRLGIEAPPLKWSALCAIPEALLLLASR